MFDRIGTIVLAVALMCASAGTAFGQPATADGARAVAAQFLAAAPGDKKAALAKLRPTAADYRAAYREPLSRTPRGRQKSLWDSGQGLSGRPNQTEVIITFARTDDLIDGKPVLGEFPGGYKDVTSQMIRGVPIVRFRGKTAGWRTRIRPCRFFTAYSTNSTPDPGTWICKSTDAQLKVAIREGRRPDGTAIRPPMPFELYRGLADADLDAIVAYLRTVPAICSSTG